MERAAHSRGTFLDSPVCSRQEGRKRELRKRATAGRTRELRIRNRTRRLYVLFVVTRFRGCGGGRRTGNESLENGRGENLTVSCAFAIERAAYTVRASSPVSRLLILCSFSSDLLLPITATENEPLLVWDR